MSDIDQPNCISIINIPYKLCQCWNTDHWADVTLGTNSWPADWLIDWLIYWLIDWLISDQCLHDIIERELNGETTLDCHWKSILRVNAVGHLKAFVLLDDRIKIQTHDIV